MDCPWIAHGLPVGCAWDAYGLFVGRTTASCPWAADGLPAGCPWATHGLLSNCPRTAHEQPMGSSWAADGQSMGSRWATHGLPVGCPWDAHVMNKKLFLYKSNNVDLRNRVVPLGPDIPGILLLYDVELYTWHIFIHTECCCRRRCCCCCSVCCYTAAVAAAAAVVCHVPGGKHFCWLLNLNK